MKKKIVGGLAAFVVAAVAGWNVYLATSAQSNEMSDLMLANVEALAEGESGDLTWNCSTYTSDTYTEGRWSYQCNMYCTVRVDTRSCNNGMISWCYPGYITTYYDCNGNVDEVNDQTFTSNCW